MLPVATSAGPRPVVLVGQANVGKSVLFGLLTGEYAWVSNYPGTTVEVARGRIAGGRREVVDTPGVNSLSAESEDERVAVEILNREKTAVLVQVADARNLPRALSLATQLADLGRPLVLVVNFMDEAEAAGLKFHFDYLEELLGCEVVPMVAVEGRGLGQLRRALDRARVPELNVETAACGPAASGCPAAALCGPARNGARPHVPGSRVWQQRQRWLASEMPRIVVQASNGRLPWSEQIDSWLRFFPAGLLVMLAVGAALYAAVGMGAGALSDFLTQRVFAERLTPWLAAALGRLGWAAFTDFVAGRYGLFSTGISYALGLVLPVLAAFFFLFALLEDSGYLPRLAVLWHRAMRRVGLSGKAVLPLVLGLGCGTAAVVSTRVLPTRRERILASLLLAVGIPCSAQLGVLLGLVAGLSFWVPLVIAVVIAVQLLWVGAVAARLLPGGSPDFLLELPPLRLPRPSNLARKTLLRVAWYLKEALPIFVLGAGILFALDRLRWIDGMVSLARPVVSGWLGLPPDTAVAFVMGFLRRDYGAAGIYALARSGQMDLFQIIVAATTLVLFMPCLANFLMLLKEFGARVAVRVALATTAVALLAGGLLRWLLGLL